MARLPCLFIATAHCCASSAPHLSLPPICLSRRRRNCAGVRERIYFFIDSLFFLQMAWISSGVLFAIVAARVIFALAMDLAESPPVFLHHFFWRSLFCFRASSVLRRRKCCLRSSATPAETFRHSPSPPPLRRTLYRRPDASTSIPAIKARRRPISCRRIPAASRCQDERRAGRPANPQTRRPRCRRAQAGACE